MKRAFFVLHSLGIDRVTASTAADALAKAFVPLGFRDAQAVIDAEYVQSAEREAREAGGAFRAYLGEAHTAGGGEQ